MAHWDIAAVRAAQRELRSVRGIAGEVAKAARPGIDAMAWGAIGGRITSYGEAWAPLKGGGEASSSIAHRMQVVDTGTSIKVRLDRVASYHDRGTKHMPARPILPRDDQGIPRPWRTEITEVATAIFAAKVKDH